MIGCELCNKASVVVSRDEPSPRENIVQYGRGKTFVCMKTFIFLDNFSLIAAGLINLHTSFRTLQNVAVAAAHKTN